MKRFFVAFFVAFFMLLASTLSAQLVKTLELKVPGENGSNAGGVVWHPLYKKYFTFFCGNRNFPFVDFDEKGVAFTTKPENLIISGADLRGLWYNTANRRLEFNGYNENGIGHYHINRYGIPDSILVDAEGMNQPNPNAVGFYNTDLNTIAFPSEDFIIYKYTLFDGTTKSEKILALHLGCKNQEEVDKLTDSEWTERIEARNNNVQYTGISGSEYVVLNSHAAKLEFYSAKTGFLTKSVTLPGTIALEDRFNFSYSNKQFWFFDKSRRTWLGYK